MKQFTDTTGRTWSVEINAAAIKKVRDLLQINLYEVIENRLVERLLGDPILLCEVVYIVCKADTRGVSQAEFLEAMAGDAIENATHALLEEIVGFSPNPRERENRRRVLQATYRVIARAQDMVEARLSSGAIEKAAGQALANASASFGEPPGSSA